MFGELLRATKFIQPKYIIGESVKGLLSRRGRDGKKCIDTIKESFGKEGYTIIYGTLLGTDFGLPQIRERLFIVGIKQPNIRYESDRINA